MLTLETLVMGKTDAQCIVDMLTHEPKAIIHDASLELFDDMIEQWLDNVIYLEDYRK